MNIRYLISMDYLSLSTNPITQEWNSFKDKYGNNCICIGQYDPETGKPSGIVRVIYEFGGIYEG